MATKADNLRQTGYGRQDRGIITGMALWRYEKGFGKPDVWNGVGSYWIENINWMRVASDLEVKTANSLTRRL